MLIFYLVDVSLSFKALDYLLLWLCYIFSCYLLIVLPIFPIQLTDLSFWFSWLTFSSVLAFSFAETTFQEMQMLINI